MVNRDPSIMGTLFERGLDPDKRSQLGAHYTDRDKIMAIIEPVLIEPLLKEWRTVESNIAHALTPAQRDAEQAVERASRYTELTEEYARSRRLSKRRQLDLFEDLTRQRRVRTLDAVRAELRAASKRLSDRQRDAEALMKSFLSRLRAFRVLDPACGSGNFLYLALIGIKDIEHQAMIEAEAMGLQREFPQVGPEAVRGIEVNPYAAELARVSVWIGHIQWARRHGYPPPSNPGPRSLATIECRDALLNEDGTEAGWPDADVVVGNPPFLGDKLMNGILGQSYVQRLRSAYHGRVPGAADLVMYWFAKAHGYLTRGALQRFGLVATNSVRQKTNRFVIEAIQRDAEIFDAWSDEIWVNQGAAVQVSLICVRRDVTGERCRLNGAPSEGIYADLTPMSSEGGADFTKARRLTERCCPGCGWKWGDVVSG